MLKYWWKETSTSKHTIRTCCERSERWSHCFNATKQQDWTENERTKINCAWSELLIEPKVSFLWAILNTKRTRGSGFKTLVQTTEYLIIITAAINTYWCINEYLSVSIINSLILIFSVIQSWIMIHLRFHLWTKMWVWCQVVLENILLPILISISRCVSTERFQSFLSLNTHAVHYGIECVERPRASKSWAFNHHFPKCTF